jgi:hypothetical protein
LRRHQLGKATATQEQPEMSVPFVMAQVRAVGATFVSVFLAP